MKSIVLITNIPNHYRIPLFNRLDQLLKKEGIQFSVIFGAGGYAFRKNKVNLKKCDFNYKILEESRKGNGRIEYGGLVDCLKDKNADLIIVSGFNKATLKTFLYGLKSKTPYFIWSGSVQIGDRKTPFLKKIFRRVMIQYANGFIAYGSMAKQYLQTLGASADQIYAIGNTVETKEIINETKKERIKENSIKPKKRLLYLGYLTPLKNLFPIIHLIDELRKHRTDFTLDVVGDGVSRNELEAEVRKKDLEDFVKFHGFKQRDEVPSFYANANFFLFQTEADIWGLVLNEAMSAGIPTLVSKRAGAAVDLVKEGETGFVVDFHDTNEVLDKLMWLLDNPEKAKLIGQKAADFIQSEYSIDVVANRFKEAILS